jgi:hypothetical protein
MTTIFGTTYCPECGHHHPIIQAEDGHCFTMCDYQTAESWPDVNDLPTLSPKEVYRRMESETLSRDDVHRAFRTMVLIQELSDKRIHYDV